MNASTVSDSSFFQKVLKNIILYGLPILYFAIAVSFYLGTYDSAQIKITLLQCGGLFLLMSWLVLKVEQADLSFFKSNFIYLIPILLFLVSGFISFAGSPYKLVSFNEFIRRFIYVGFALIVITEFDDENKLLLIKNWLIFAAYVVCIYGLMQILDYKFFPKDPNGFGIGKGLDPFLWRQAFAYRAMSTFGNPNFFGDFLIVMSPITLALFFRKKNLYLIFLWLLIVINTFATFSKGALLGLGSGLVVFAVVYVLTFLKDKISRRLKSIIIGAVLVIVLGGLGTFVFTLSMSRTDSLSFRVYTWLATWDMINTNPVLGTGIGTFYVTYPAYRRPQIFFIEGKHNTESDHPENEYLEVWFDEGTIGFAIFILLIVFVFTLGYKNLLYLQSGNGTRDGPLAYIQLGVIAAFAAKLTHDSFCVSLRFVSSGVMLWLLVGITIAIAVQLAKNKIEPKKINISKMGKTAIQAVIILVFGYGIYFFYGYFTADILHSQAIQLSKTGSWDRAIATYDQVNVLNPSYPMSKYFKANVFVDRSGKGDLLNAEAIFKDLWTNIAPNYVQSKYLAGVMYTKMFEEAAKTRAQYIKEGRSKEVIEMQTKIMLDAFNKAVQRFNEYMMIDPVYPLTYYSLARMYEYVGDLKTAEAMYYKHLTFPQTLQQHPHDIWKEDWASRRASDYAETYLQIGNFYMKHGQFQAGKEAYLKSLALVPNYMLSKKNLTLALAALHDYAAVRQQWVEIYLIDPNDQDARKYLQNAGILQWLDAYRANPNDQTAINKLLSLGILKKRQ